MAMLGATASAQEFATRQQAVDYISATLPKATAANPEYLTKADGTLTRWFTDDVHFETDAKGGVTVTMREHFVATKAGKNTQARHEARFALSDVTVGLYELAGDVTPSGQPALGLAFTCKTPGCVAALWGEAPSHADMTDVSIQDKPTRDRLMTAFRRLQTP